MVGRPGIPIQVRREFWQQIRIWLPIFKAAKAVGVPITTAQRWHRDAGGVNPYPPNPVSGRYLSFEEREEIAVGLGVGHSQAQIARDLGRDRSTICHAIKRNSTSMKSHKHSAGLRYRARFAQYQADQQARRSKESKLAADTRLRDEVQAGLKKCWSPEQIVSRLVVDFPDEEGMRVSHETIYRSLYIQGKGGLERELIKQLRTGRKLRKAHKKTDERRGRVQNMVPISDRPAAAEDRAMPGSWEGDLVLGARCASAIGTLVERTTRFALLAHLQGTHDATSVREAVAAQMVGLPAHLAHSLTWDQGKEMAQHLQFSVDTGIKVYCADPHSPWQRGTNENTVSL